MEYIRVAFVNMEPVRISDDSASQSGQTQTLSYIPGSSLRGAVINELLRTSEIRKLEQSDGQEQKTEGFTEEIEINQYLSESARFLNAYPVFRDSSGIHELIPSLKGFYEDKKDVGDEVKTIESVVKDGDIIPGHKRASLGTFGYPSDGIFHFTSMKKSGDLKINLGKNGKDKKNVFRNQYLCAGYEFVTYIGVKDPALKEDLKNRLEEIREEDHLLLGNARSAGLGKCFITQIGEWQTDFPYKAYAATENAYGKVYMVLLSDTAMLSDEGEVVGLREDILQQKLGVSELKMERCSTSVVQVRGYNRTWETHVPSTTMFQMGSVFRLTFTGTLTVGKMLEIENEGVGIRKNEGFGRVLFLKDYENLQKKQKIAGDIRDSAPKTAGAKFSGTKNEDRRVLQIAARGVFEGILERKVQEYLNSPPTNWSGNVSLSQMGTARAILSRYRFSPDEGIAALKQYLSHQEEKKIQRNYHGSEDPTLEELSGTARDIMEKSLGETLGMDTEKVFGFSFEELFYEEINRRKLDLLIRRMDRENREAKKSSFVSVGNGGQTNE